MPDQDLPVRETRRKAPHIRILPLGDAALTVEFGNEIDPGINERVIAFANIVRAQRWSGLLDIVPTYRSVTIHVDPFYVDLATLSSKLLSLSPSQWSHVSSSGRHHTIPVLYGGEWGPDLDELAAFANMPVGDVIGLHASVPYRVYMLGFSPGFAYMGTVPEKLAMPRLATPRASVPAGSVGIAGSQTGIYSIPSPGGWRLIGRTPVALSRETISRPFLLGPGDFVTFEPIGRNEFDRLRRESDDDHC